MVSEISIAGQEKEQIQLHLIMMVPECLLLVQEIDEYSLAQDLILAPQLLILILKT